MAGTTPEMRTGEGHLRRHWALVVVGAVVLLLGLVLAAGGAWLAWLGGSWYYVLAGIGLAVAGVQLVRGRMSGAWWFGAVFIGTVAWAAWESGLDYWRWVPRLGLMVVLAFAVALLLPRLRGGRFGGASRAVSWSFAGLMAVVFAGFLVLAFVPHGVVVGDEVPAPVAGRAGEAAPAPGDWPAYGRSNGARRYSPLAQIDRTNVERLERA